MLLVRWKTYSINDSIIYSLIGVKVLGPADGLLYLLRLMVCVLTQYPDLQQNVRCNIVADG